MWAVAILALAQVDARPLSPADAVAAAHADLARLPAAVRPFVRYLSLYNLPSQDRAQLALVLNVHCNSLSREPDLMLPAVAGPALLRVVLKDYRWPVDVWEQLVDPYFSAQIETEIAEPWGFYDRFGRWTQTKVERKRVKQQALAPWLADTPEQRRLVADVASWTHSKAPIVRADWFLDLTSAAEDRSPNYYDFLQVTDEKSFQDLVGVDVKLAETFSAVLRDAVSISAITKYDRALLVLGAVRGHYHKSLDFKRDKAGTALRVLGKDVEKDIAATEQIGGLPNRLLAFGLFDAKGKRQDKAPDDVVKLRVDVYRSCIECHSNGGFQDVDSWVAPLLKGPLDLRSPDYDTARQIRREYLEGLAEAIAEDRARYEKRVKQLTGLDSKAYSQAITAAIRRYEDAPVGLVRSAADLGVTTSTWKAALERQLLAGTLDTVLAPLARGRAIGVRAWESSIVGAHLVLKGYLQVQP